MGNAHNNRFGSPGLRLMQLYMLLASTGRPCSLTRLAAILSCSRQTILRMIEQIERIPKAECQSWLKSGERFFQIKSSTPSANLAFTPENLRQLVLCRDIVSHLLPETSRKELHETLRLLTPETVQDTTFAEPWGKGFIDYSPFQDILETVQDAMRLSRLCRVRYQSRSLGRSLEYRVAPLRIIAYREALYLRCRLYDAGARPAREYRTLAVHRVKSLHMERAGFKPADSDDREPGFGFPFHEPLRVRVAFQKGAAEYVAERTWSPGQKLTRRKDGTLILTFNTTSRFEVISWVLGFGPDAELLEPEDLRREVREKVEAIAERYAESKTRGDNSFKSTGDRQ